jgi:predicted transposase YdaD
MSDKPDHPHDKFFKETFTNLTRAAAELRAVLPREVVALLRWESLRLESGNFEATNERSRFCDLLFSCERAGGEGQVLVYVLFEHQSGDTAIMLLRMLRYMVQVWERWLQTKQGLPLPPILPVVLSHDERGWRSARRFADLFELDEGTLTLLRPFVPDFEVVVDDLAKVTDDEIDARGLPPHVALSLWALRDGRSPESLLAHLPFWARVVADLDGTPGGVEALLRIMEYLGNAAGERSVDLKQFAALLAEHSPVAQDLAMTSLERLLDEGRQQGRLLERRELLLEQLREKFGELSDADEAKIAEADAETLADCVKRIIRADSVAAVLGG